MSREELEVVEGLLGEDINPEDIKTREQGGKKLSYLEGWHVEAELNRIFGPLGWSRETTYCEERERGEKWTEEKRGRPDRDGNPGKILKERELSSYQIVYVAKVRLRIELSNGEQLIKEGTGGGSGYSKAGWMDCHEGAAKEAETDAFKRAAKQLGWKLGLALYDGNKRHVAMVAGRRPREERTQLTRAESRAEGTFQAIIELMREQKDVYALDELVSEAGFTARCNAEPDNFKDEINKEYDRLHAELPS